MLQSIWILMSYTVSVTIYRLRTQTIGIRSTHQYEPSSSVNICTNILRFVHELFFGIHPDSGKFITQQNTCTLEVMSENLLSYRSLTAAPCIIPISSAFRASLASLRLVASSPGFFKSLDRVGASYPQLW